MLIVLVANNQIAGVSDSDTNLPSGFKAYRVQADSIDSLYYDAPSDSVKPRPVKPGDGYIWANNQWRPPIVSQLPIPTPLTQLAAFKPVLTSLGDKDAILANLLIYILARLENDFTLTSSSYTALLNAVAAYQAAKASGSTGSSSTGTTGTGTTGTGSGTGTTSPTGGTTSSGGSGTTTTSTGSSSTSTTPTTGATTTTTTPVTTTTTTVSTPTSPVVSVKI